MTWDIDTTRYASPLDTDRLTIRQLYATLRPEVERLDDGHEYFSLAPLLTYDDQGRVDRPIGRCRWLACYAVTGGSEGHYVHVDRLWVDDALALQREALFLSKTFGGYETACKIAAHLGARLGA